MQVGGDQVLGEGLAKVKRRPVYARPVVLEREFSAWEFVSRLQADHGRNKFAVAKHASGIDPRCGVDGGKDRHWVALGVHAAAIADGPL